MKKPLRRLFALTAFAAIATLVQSEPYTVLSANTEAQPETALPESNAEAAPAEGEVAVIPEVGTVSLPAAEEPAVPKLIQQEKPAAAKIALVAPKEQKTAVAPASKYGRLSIPAIGLSRAIGAVGLTSTGNMGVLDDPSRVSWYRGGAVPGEVGSAVIGAHVYQSFGNLKNLNVGDSIYVERDGKKLRFIVRETAIYAYTDPSPLRKIFSRNDAARLNLITCYGQLTAGGSTYTHRLVVYATLA